MARAAELIPNLDFARAEAAGRYPLLWSNMITRWKRPDKEDRAWLMYSANYLFRTGEVRWALDPLTLKSRLELAPEVDAARDLRDLSFVLLSHQHKDHLDIDLIHALRELPITWVVPEFIRERVEQAGILRRRIIVPRMGESLAFNSITILPFEGLHWEGSPSRAEGLRGVPAAGYLVEFNDKRWLFPGDTRDFRSGKFPDPGPVTGIFAHLWLGRGGALLVKPPLLDPFCRFHMELKPSALVIAHLYDFGRGAEDFWCERHSRLVSGWFEKNAKWIRIQTACMGDEVEL